MYCKIAEYFKIYKTFKNIICESELYFECRTIENIIINRLFHFLSDHLMRGIANIKILDSFDNW